MPKKFTIDMVRRIDTYEKTAQPDELYYMVSKSESEKILSEGVIKPASSDNMCWVFSSAEDIPSYIKLVGSDKGRQHYNSYGFVVTEPPLDHENTVVLKLKPRYKEPDLWFRQIVNEKKKGYEYLADNEEEKKKWEEFGRIRLAHFGSIKFRTFEDDIEVIELTEIDKKYA